MKTELAGTGFHELSEKQRAGNLSDRSFGLYLGAIITCLSLLPLLAGRNYNRYLAVSGLVLILLGAFLPSVLSPLNKLWTRLGVVLQRVMNPVFLSLIFWGSVVPTGFLMRMFRKDPLRLKPDPKLDSYWIQRHKRSFEPDSFKHQF